MVTPEELEAVTLAALTQAYALHQQMGTAGTQPMQTNQFGETALALDVAVEEVVLATFAATQASIEFITEEHGSKTVGTTPNLLGIVDGIDGSSIYRAARGTGRYGTMVAVYEGIAPSYGDYLVCGIMLHSPSPQVILARRGAGCVAVQGNARRVLHCAQTARLADVSALAYDDHFAVNRAIFADTLVGYPLQSLHSSAAHFADLANGTVDAVLECTRKHNLEFAVAYGIVAESGGVMLTMNGESLGKQPYRIFSPLAHNPIVAASTQSLGHDILRRVASPPSRQSDTRY